MESPPSGLATGAAPEKNIVFNWPQNLVEFSSPSRKYWIRKERCQLVVQILLEIGDQFLFLHKYCDCLECLSVCSAIYL